MNHVPASRCWRIRPCPRGRITLVVSIALSLRDPSRWNIAGPGAKGIPRERGASNHHATQRAGLPAFHEALKAALAPAELAGAVLNAQPLVSRRGAMAQGRCGDP